MSRKRSQKQAKAQPSASQSSNSTQTQELESDDEQLPEHAKPSSKNKKKQKKQYKISGLIRKLITDTSNNNEWEPVEVIEAEGPTESIGKYLADLYKAASDA
ncbi:hypothetical protein C2G38_2039515 [Gigaspora rosea]|uniref:Uncharacterized protein n=1 Tax=Gigaspora rosea TaxID=44941 RepID=A0A397UZX4_9GLOM|nr:hypothetical protein C2G38_2039515 [Gigaspora rosea]